MQIHESFCAWFDKHRGGLDALVFDIDGVLVRGGVALPGSLELIQGLRESGIPFGLLTNDGNHSVAEKAAGLARHGFDITQEEITNCMGGLAEFAEGRGLGGRLFFVAGDSGEPCGVEAAGLKVTRELERLGECHGIILSEEHYDWDRVINGVLNHLLRHPGKPLVVPNPDEYYPIRDGGIHIAAGGVARFIQRVAQINGVTLEPLYLGKPHLPIYAHNHRALERRAGQRIPRERVLMLGDSLAADIRGANDFGYRSGLLLTGITGERHFATAAIKPTHVFRGF